MKRFATVLSAMMLMVCMCMPAFANDGTVTMYTTTTVYAYALPNASSQVIATIPAGTSVVTYPDKAQNGFQQCFTNATSFCYVPSVFLSTSGGSPSPSPSPTPTPTPTSYVERVVKGTTNYLALRSYPSREAQYEKGKLYNGETFYVTEFRNDGFAYGFTKAGEYGYVVSDYLAVPGSSTGTTWYNGHDWSPVYNYEYYKNAYPDVVNALGTDPSALIAHFVNHGIYEARQARADWNVYNYMAQHPELFSRFGYNYAAYYNYAVGIIQ